MFSEAISSISSRWRPTSSSMARAISGSLSASPAEKKLFDKCGLAASIALISILVIDRAGRPSDARIRGPVI
jgi:hypothetical protein